MKLNNFTGFILVLLFDKNDIDAFGGKGRRARFKCLVFVTDRPWFTEYNVDLFSAKY